MDKKFKLTESKPIPLDDPAVAPQLLALRAYPAIQERIEKLWGTKELGEFFNSWLSDTRGHQRQGFPKQESAALIALSTMHATHLVALGIEKPFDGAEVPSWVPQKWALPKHF